MKMVETGVITAEEGQKLIQTIQKSQKNIARQNPNIIGHFLRLDILSVQSGENTNIEIKFPLNLARAILKMGIVQKQLTDKVGEKVDLDVEKILSLIDSEINGDLMILNTKESKIRIWIE
ncbi:MAG: hypothetical protein II005_09215 [Turicibacter sp.]|nr:hypothetical protein [Turicibacter sp.]MBQ1786880.1 hypothetical protein [Turicibacter sp.]